MSKADAPLVRAIRESDRDQWAALWTGYLEFYETELDASIYDATFARLLADDPHGIFGFVAERDGDLVGLVHYLFHAHAWRTEPVCYLQDLFAAPTARGSGAGRALIEAVYADADARGAPNVYWMTQEFNSTARQLYDRIGTLTPFIKYTRPTP